MNEKRPTIALLLDHFLGDYQSDVRKSVGFSVKERDADFLCFICRPIDSPNRYERVQNSIIDHITADAISGVIVVGATLSVYSGKERIAEICRRLAPLPVCNIGLTIDGIPSVVLDNRRIDRTVKHLAEVHGCHRFAYIGGPEANEEAVLRRAGFLEALAKHDLPFDPALERTAKFTRLTGCEAMTQILETRKPFEALVVANDTMALGALSILHKHGIRVPEDVCVTGFDDMPAARFHAPSLTTMRQPIEEMSRCAVDLLLAQLSGESVPLVSKIPPSLVHRQSCGCSRTRRETIRLDEPVPLSGTDLIASIREHRTDIEHSLLSNVRISETSFSGWAVRLVDALIDELDHHHGRFVRVVEDILNAGEYRLWLIDELQNAVSVIRSHFRETHHDDQGGLESVWHDARLALSDAATYGQMQNQIAADLTSALFLRRAAAEPPTSLIGDTLARAIAGELETIGLENGMVWAFSKDDNHALEPVVVINDGTIMPFEPKRYPVGAAVGDILKPDRRMSFVVVPLTSGEKRLGVMMLELGAADLYYEILREHMSSHLKNIEFIQDRLAEQRAAADKHRKELALQHRQKLESLGVLAGGIAHDFNNMLSAIMGNLDAALFDLEAHDLQPSPILECKSVAKHASGLCRQLLAYSGKGRFLVKSVNLNRLITDLEDLLLVSVSKNVHLELELQDKLPDIEGDESQLTQIFVNLVINASEAIVSNQGRITIRTRTDYCSQAFLASNIAETKLPAGEYVIATVSDTGAGINEEKLASIFDPFYTTKFAGRGLGLAAVLGIVNGHKGAIRVHSDTRRDGSGTQFDIVFPIQPKRTLVRKEAAKPPTWVGEGTILLVDDEPDVLRAGKRLLTRLGFTVVTASDGQEGIDVFQQSDHAIVCIILDITMPGKGGIAAMQEIKALNDEVPIILTSGYSEEQAIESLHEQTPSGFLQKPYGYKTLSEVLQSVLKI